MGSDLAHTRFPLQTFYACIWNSTIYMTLPADNETSSTSVNHFLNRFSSNTYI